MSNSERKANLPAIIGTCEAKFSQLASRHGIPDFTFEREASFAIQILRDNPYLAEIACGNPDSLKEAVTNVAAIGLSLSTVHNFAYLVPRTVRGNSKVCLDISYRGYIELATSKGIIHWVKAELVKDNDTFEYRGVNQEPIHKFDPFRPRGEIIGGYVIAKMTSGDLLIDFMSIAEIYVIRDRAEGYKAYKSNKIKSTPWVTDESEMIKKTLIRRGRKSWPSSVSKDLDQAVDVTSDEVNHDVQLEALPSEPDPYREEGLSIIREHLEALERTEESFVEHLCKTTNRAVKELEDLTDLEIDQAVTFLEGVVEAQSKRFEKLKSKERSSEDVD